MEKGCPSTPGSTQVETFRHTMTKILISVVWGYFCFKYSHSPDGLSDYKELREEDVLGADWQLPYEQGSICQHPIWRTAEPLGGVGGAHGPGRTKLRGCSQPSLGAWPFRVIDRRSKRHFLRGDLWRHWHGGASLSLTESKQYLGFECWDHNVSHSLPATINFDVFLLQNRTTPLTPGFNSPHVRFHLVSPFNSKSIQFFSIYIGL